VSWAAPQSDMRPRWRVLLAIGVLFAVVFVTRELDGNPGDGIGLLGLWVAVSDVELCAQPSSSSSIRPTARRPRLNEVLAEGQPVAKEGAV
jgi:hypothetical protein